MREKLVPDPSGQALDALRKGRFDPARLLYRGVEKESLRVDPNGMLAHTPHPRALGSALMHPQITTDFCESQLELITGVHPDADDCVQELTDIHRFVWSQLKDELIWPASMPCKLPAADQIPIGQYGTSNKGRTKTVYRRGLANRYGPVMQTISGIHYNFSVDDAALATLGINSVDARTAAYLALIRNFRRFSWLLISLFGASPAICRTFGSEKETGLLPIGEGSLYLPFATSLRMGPLGYTSDAQRQIHVSFNSLDDYARSIRQALSIRHPRYQEIGTLVNGEYRQLTDTLIQIENEFYGTIRPKRPLQSGERPLTALFDRGVGYVEVRCLDLNPFIPTGIDAAQMRFIDLFLLYCLLAPSPEDSVEEAARLHANQVAVVQRGREPGLTLDTGRGPEPLSQLAEALLDACEPMADWLDSVKGGHAYASALETQRPSLVDAEQTPSAQVLHRMRQGQSFFRVTMDEAHRIQTWFQQTPLSSTEAKEWSARAVSSLNDQHELEVSETIAFAAHLATYLRLP